MNGLEYLEPKLPIDALKEKLAKDLIRCQGWQVYENVDFFKSQHPRTKEGLRLAEIVISTLDEFLMDNYGITIYSILDDPN